jgi:hypothetical protein
MSGSSHHAACSLSGSMGLCTMVDRSLAYQILAAFLFFSGFNIFSQHYSDFTEAFMTRQKKKRTERTIFLLGGSALVASCFWIMTIAHS